MKESAMSVQGWHRARAAGLWLVVVLVVGLAGCDAEPAVRPTVQPCRLPWPASPIAPSGEKDGQPDGFADVVDAVDRCARAQFPTTYAGCFLDQKRGVIVLLSVDTDSARTAVSQFFDPGRIDVRAAHWSLNALEDWRGMLGRLLLGKAGYVATRLDVPRNGLVVELQDTPDGHALANQEPLRGHSIPSTKCRDPPSS